MTKQSRANLRSIDRSIDIDVDVDIEDRRQIEEKQKEGLIIHDNVAALIDAMTIQLGFAFVEARHIVGVFGAGRCEGALVKTLWDKNAGGIKKPRGWFLGALREGKEWTAEEMQMHGDWMKRRQQEAIERNAHQANNITEQRLLREEAERESGVVHIRRSR